jgi:TRAP-type C4-dicarboxylate transport system substrate-binding protein
MEQIRKSIQEQAKQHYINEHKWVKQDLHDIAKDLREAGSLIIHTDRAEDAKQQAMEAYKMLSGIVETGVLSNE